MSHRLGVAFFALALEAAVAGQVGAGEIEYHGTFDAAVEAAEKNRRLIMVIVVGPAKDAMGRDLCKMLREETLPDEQVAKLISRHFAPFLLDIELANQGKQPVPAVIQGCFKPGEQISVPMAIFLDAKCKEVHRIVGYAPAANYLGHLKAVAERALGLIPEKERRDVQRALERGKKAFEEKDFNAAMDALKAAAAGGAPGEDTDTAKRLIEEIEAKASEKCQEAEGLEAKGKPGSAVRAYQECARGFKGSEAAAKAAARLVEIRKDPDIRKRLNQHMAAKLLAKAQEDAQQKKYAAALDGIDTVIKRYADTEEAAEAKKLREKLEADPEAASRLRDGKARGEAERILALGDSFRLNKLPLKALAEYEKVAAKFPDTSFARTARERIAEVNKEIGELPRLPRP